MSIFKSPISMVLDRVWAAAKYIFSGFIYFWGIYDTGANPVYVLGSLYLLFVVWNHGFSSGEQAGKLGAMLRKSDTR